MKPSRAAIIILGPLIGFTLGAGVDRALITEHAKPEQEWCDAAFTRKQDWGFRLKSTLRPKISTLVASDGSHGLRKVATSQDSRQGH